MSFYHCRGVIVSTVGQFERAVFALEGFRIRILHDFGKGNVRSDHSLRATYRYVRKARSEWTVREFLDTRLSRLLPGYRVEVIAPNNKRVNGGTKLRTIRGRYHTVGGS